LGRSLQRTPPVKISPPLPSVFFFYHSRGPPGSTESVSDFFSPPTLFRPPPFMVLLCRLSHRQSLTSNWKTAFREVHYQFSCSSIFYCGPHCNPPPFLVAPRPRQRNPPNVPFASFAFFFGPFVTNRSSELVRGTPPPSPPCPGSFYPPLLFPLFSLVTGEASTLRAFGFKFLRRPAFLNLAALFKISTSWFFFFFAPRLSKGLFPSHLHPAVVYADTKMGFSACPLPTKSCLPCFRKMPSCPCTSQGPPPFPSFLGTPVTMLAPFFEKRALWLVPCFFLLGISPPPRWPPVNEASVFPPPHQRQPLRILLWKIGSQTPLAVFAAPSNKNSFHPPPPVLPPFSSSTHPKHCQRASPAYIVTPYFYPPDPPLPHQLLYIFGASLPPFFSTLPPGFFLV